MEVDKEYAHVMEDIYHSLPEMFFIKDIEGKYVFTTKECDLVNAGPDGTIIGKTDLDIQYDKELGQKYYQEDMNIIENGTSTHTIDRFVQNDKKIYMEVIKNPIYNDDNEVIGICGICNDITEFMNLCDKYEQLSLYDTMTGLYNRNYTVKYDFDNAASLPCSYIICDCNNLKKINDEYGHEAGDQYICEVADLLKGVVLKSSVIVRLGGDEFLIITPSCNEQTHNGILESIKAEREKLVRSNPVKGLATGGVLRTNSDISEDDILKAADRKMYEDKMQLKSRIDS